MSSLRAPNIGLADRQTYMLAPCWPFWSALLTATLALAAVGIFAGLACVAPTLFWQNILIVAFAALVASAGFSAFAVVAVMREMAGHARSNGLKSLQMLVFGTLAVLVVGLMTVDGVLWHFSYADSHGIMMVPKYIVFGVAWPLTYVIGLIYGLAALFRRADRPLLGTFGACLNGVALIWWCYLIQSAPHSRYGFY